MAAPTSGFGIVKSVLSGDTLILASTANPALERTLSLAYVSAPRLSKDGDEAFAFQSREFLRRLTVNKRVKFQVHYTVPTSNRDYGTAQLEDGTQFPDELAKAGWVKVREDAGKKEDDEEILQRIDTLRELETNAKASNTGLWGTGGVIEVQNDLGHPQFLDQWKGKTVDGIVERVLSGDRLLTRLFLSDQKHLQVMTLVGGIRTPSTAKPVASTGGVQPAEEYGNEAKAFVETRLLQREVKVTFLGASPQGQLIATVAHPVRGNIAVFLLEDGLARCNDFHSTLLGDKMAALRQAEKKAQSNQLRLHKGHVSKEAATEAEMSVSKVISADTIIVRHKDGKEERINFSSVRGPRTNEATEAPYKDEAKEFLRKKLIGKHVKVAVDGSKPAQDGYEARNVATVTLNGKNIGLAMVAEGYATAVRHRKDDTDRAQNYDELLAAHETAKTEKKGMFSGKPPKTKALVDASENVQKAKLNLGSLQRQKKIPGVVDYCRSGSRFTILIPREGVRLTLVLAGIRAPRAGRPGEQGEPFGNEALALSNKRLEQRDVEVDIQDTDKTGAFIGDLFIGRESFAKILVEEGLASVHQYSAEKSGNAAILNTAEKKAKEERKGLWKDWDPSQEQEDLEEAVVETTNELASVDLKREYREIAVTHMDENGRLKFQEVGTGTASLASMSTAFQKFHSNPSNNTPLSGAPKAGDLVAAKWSADDTWYRARIRSNDRTAKIAEVVFIDYGNTEKFPWSKLRPLNQAEFSTQKLRPQAVDASLTLLQLPTAPHYFKDAKDFLEDVLFSQAKWVASFDFVDNKEGLTYLTIYDHKEGSPLPKAHESVNRDVLSKGFALVPRKLKAWERSPALAEIMAAYRKAEEEAKSTREGMWEYGDLTED